MARVPAPRAVAEPICNAPAAKVSPPAPALEPVRARTPAPVLRTGAPKVTSPETSSDDVPVPSTAHVWLLAPAPVDRTSGAEMVTVPALGPTEMPPEVLDGARVSDPAVPAAISTDVVTDDVALMNCSPSIVKLPSKVVLKAPPVRLLALNKTVSAATGVAA